MKRLTQTPKTSNLFTICPHQTHLAEATRPEFVSAFPGQLEVAQGGRLDIPCVARGTPTPDVLWYVNAAAEPAGVPGVGSNNLVIDPVDGPLGVVCVARNSGGAIFAPVRVTTVKKPTGTESRTGRNIVNHCEQRMEIVHDCGDYNRKCTIRKQREYRWV